MSSYLSFKHNPEREILENWWKDLQSEHKAERARLRRCKTIEDVYTVRSFYTLLNAYPQQADKKAHLDALAMIAALSAHVKDKGIDTKMTLAQQMGHGADPKVKEVRFRKWLTTVFGDDLLVTTLRLIHLLDNRVNLFDLADKIYTWGFSDTHKKLAYEYFNANYLTEKEDKTTTMVQGA